MVNLLHLEHYDLLRVTPRIMTKPKRKLTPYEQTQLARHNLIDIDITEYGQMPVEYITGRAPFCGHDFLVTKDVLIPREETQELVEKVASVASEKSAKQASTLIIADVGTGSGAVGLSVANKLRKKQIPAEVWCSDISAEAVAVAGKNAEELDLLEAKADVKSVTARLIVSNLLSAYPRDWKADILIANLPYIPSERVAYLDESVKSFEPHLALDGGQEGLSLIHSFLHQAEDSLKQDGTIFLEVDHTHNVGELIPRDLRSTFSAILEKDSFGQPRFATISFK